MSHILQEIQIFGPTYVYAQYMDMDKIIIEKYEHYQKRSFRNRYQILSPNGPQTLSIPLSKGKNAGMLITDITISYDENWTDKHLHAIRSAYGKSPYFEHYYPVVEHILKRKFKYLFDLNMLSLQKMISKLNLQIEITYTSHYMENVTDNVWQKQKIMPSDDQKIKYTQVWDKKFDFLPNLSILDLLFCTGPEATAILNKMNMLNR